MRTKLRFLLKLLAFTCLADALRTPLPMPSEDSRTKARFQGASPNEYERSGRREPQS